MMFTLPLPNQTKTVSYTLCKREILLHCHGTGKLKILLIGGVHGDESEGFLLAEHFLDQLCSDAIHLDQNIQLYICPRLNPDGCANDRRTNQHNVDLNRNLPTKDWQSRFTNVRYYPGPQAASEIETKLTVKLIQKIKPELIFSLHSYEKPMVNYNGPCEDLAKAMSVENKLPAKGDIGYPTPGSLGTYAGWERKIPTITLEIRKGEQKQSVWQTHYKALITGMEYYLFHSSYSYSKRG